MSVRAQSVSRHQLVDLIERQIMNNELRPGMALPSERKLSERYSVSRSAVREALRVLGERRLVVVEQGRGAFVREPDPAAAAAAISDALRREQVTARHVIVGRRVLECETAFLAAAARTKHDLDAMDQALVELRDDAALLDRVKADLTFHMAVARAAHNPVLEAMFGSITGLAAELMLRSLSDREVSHAGLPQHRAIRDAISDGDAIAARDHMAEHLDVAFQRYGADLDRRLDTVAEHRLSDLVGPSSTLDDVFQIAAATRREHRP